MTVRITTLHQPSQTIIKIDGRLEVVDLEDLCGLLEGITGATSLDLKELQSVDQEAAEKLDELLDLGVELRAVSPYLDLMLKSQRARQSDRDTT